MNKNFNILTNAPATTGRRTQVQGQPRTCDSGVMYLC